MKSHWIARPLIVAATALLGGIASADDGSSHDGWNALAVDPGIELALQVEIAHPVDAPWLLASSVIDASPPNRVSDPWWTNAALGPHREPTDPDSPSLPAGSSLESPWEAWENQAVDSRGEWESLDPEGR